MAFDPDKIQPPKAVQQFARTINRHLPKRLRELQRVGRSMRALTAPKRRG